MIPQIPVVIVLAQAQKEKVEKLYRHCLALDGTHLEVIDGGDEVNEAPNRYHAAHLALRKACDTFRSKPFLWLEPDSIPLQANWKRRIEREYMKSGRLFLLPDLSGLSPTDHASGIGVYPAGARNIIPRFKPLPPFFQWDHWLYVTKRRLIKFTRSIQHSYGVHGADGRLQRRHVFPHDMGIIRAEALIFHSDPMQGLITQP